MSEKEAYSNKKILEHYPTLTLHELILIIELVREDGKKMSDGSETSIYNYKQLRSAYATELLARAVLEGALDKTRNSALKKLHNESLKHGEKNGSNHH